MTMFAHSFASFTLSSNCWSAVSQVSVALTLSGWSVGRHWKKPTFADLRRPAPTCADLRRLAPTCADLRRLSPTFADLRRPRKIFFGPTTKIVMLFVYKKGVFINSDEKNYFGLIFSPKWNVKCRPNNGSRLEIFRRACFLLDFR